MTTLPKICERRPGRGSILAGFTMRLTAVVVVLAGLTLAVTPLAGQSGALATYHVQGNVWVIAGAGGNITVQASDAQAAGPGAGEGVLLVDAGRQDRRGGGLFRTHR